MARGFPLFLLSGCVLCTGTFAYGQTAPSGVLVEQVSPPRVRIGDGGAIASTTHLAPIRDRSSSASAQEGGLKSVAPAVPAEVVEACRLAQAEDRPPPEGVDCMAALQLLSQASSEATAESSLLEMFGQPGAVTTASNMPSGASTDADNVARNLSTGDVQNTSVAGVVARDRVASPPPNSPR